MAAVHRRSGSVLRRAVTLLELMLALSLSVVVLMAVNMAITLHFRMLDKRRTNVEEAQIARVALKFMADDLRGALLYTPPDLSGLQEVTNNAAQAATELADSALGGDGGGAGRAGGGQGTTQGQGGGTSGGTGAASGGGQSAAGSSGSQTAGGSGAGGSTAGPTASSGTSAEDSAAAPASVVGLIGSATELRIDISRLPRVDQYAGSLSADGQLSVMDIPSDVKTIAYFLLDESAAPTPNSPLTATVAPVPSTTGRGRGLMRSETSRAVASWTEANGGDTSVYDGSRLLAEEVVGLEFQYYDGTGWVAEWDSNSMGGLPKAVEIVLYIQPTYALTDAVLPTALSTADGTVPEQRYRMVVNIPSAPLVASSTTETEATAESTSSSTTQGVMP